jgi:hypothetical protein
MKYTLFELCDQHKLPCLEIHCILMQMVDVQ